MHTPSSARALLVAVIGSHRHAVAKGLARGRGERGDALDMALDMVLSSSPAQEPAASRLAQFDSFGAS